MLAAAAHRCFLTLQETCRRLQNGKMHQVLGLLLVLLCSQATALFRARLSVNAPHDKNRMHGQTSRQEIGEVTQHIRVAHSKPDGKNIRYCGGDQTVWAGMGSHFEVLRL